MAAGKEFLTEILDGVLAIQLFLTDGLGSESLSPGCEAQRNSATMTLENIVKKIQNAHPSIRPRVNTPGRIKKPAPPPPTSPAMDPPLPEEDEGEVYEEPAPDQGAPPAEDYLSFSPTQTNGVMADGEQEMYEAMETGQQDLYEEPVSSTSLGENYEDPVISRPNNVSTTSLPPPSHSPAPLAPQVEQIPEDVQYAETTGMFHDKEQQQFGENMADMSMDWGNVYTTPSKGEKLKVSSLSNVKIKGPLEKLGGRSHKTWQKRYCVLSGALMYFYEKESSKTYNNCIAVLSFKATPALNVTNDKKKQFGFKLTQEDSATGKHKDYYFRATTAELRDKWLSCVGNVDTTTSTSSLLSLSASRQVSAATLPRMPSQVSPVNPPVRPEERRRARSVGQEEEEGELYEDMAVTDDGEGTIEELNEDAEEELDEYVDIDTGKKGDDRVIELESSEEYVDIVPQGDVEQEEYEDTSTFQQPPPPLSPPPGPPSEVFMPPPPQQGPPSKAPAPPPLTEPEVNTSEVYTQETSGGIVLEKVYVSLWDFAGGEGDELVLHRGDLVFVNRPLDTQLWWYGELLDADASRKLGPAGFFPQNYSTLAFETVSS